MASVNDEKWCRLVNGLGTGLPHLTMKLGNNGLQWGSYVLDYEGEGNVPGGIGPAAWSSWNIYDEKNNWYGTVTLMSDGLNNGKIWQAAEKFYVPPVTIDPHNFNLLADFSLSELSPGKYKLAVADVYPSFPFAPAAKPAVWPDNTPIALKTVGPKIVNNRNETVVLKGVARPSLEWPLNGLPEGYYGQRLSPSDIKTIRGWGANVIRISLNEIFWRNSNSRDVIGSYKQIVDAMIYYAIEQKMAVILDLHRINPNDQGQMANNWSIDFWTDVAKTYKDFGTVLFELFNEPHDITKEQWLNGDGGNIVGYQQLYNAVRGAGANNLCIVGGLDWAYDLSFVQSNFGVKGTNIVYCSHPYYPKGNDQAGKFSPASNFAGVLGKFPVIFTEFGGNSADQYQGGAAKQFLLDYYTQLISYVNTNGFHYTGWGWWVGQPDFPCLIGDWAGGAINGGKIIKDDLQTHPGKGVG